MTAPRKPLSISRSIVDALISIEQANSPCWRVRRYLGSMLTIEFGAKLSGVGKKGAFEIGSSGMGVRNCHWIYSGNDVKVTSESVNEDSLLRMNEMACGSHLLGCQMRRQRMIFSFSNGAHLSLDLTNRYEAEPGEAIASLKLEGGLFLELIQGADFVIIPSASRRPSVELAA